MSPAHLPGGQKKKGHQKKRQVFMPFIRCLVEIVILTNRKEKTYNIPKKGVQVMDEEMTAIEMQRFLNQQYAEGKTELEAYRNLMAILGLSYPQKSEKEK